LQSPVFPAAGQPISFSPSPQTNRFAGLLAQEMLLTLAYVRPPFRPRAAERPAGALTFFAFIKPVNIHSRHDDFPGRKHCPERREASVYAASRPPLTTVNKSFILSAIVNFLSHLFFALVSPPALFDFRREAHLFPLNQSKSLTCHQP
jgi:hypothetical protein